MSYREKIAWLSLIALTVTFGPYFVLVKLGFSPDEPLPNLRQLALYGVVAMIQALILGVGHLYLRRQSPQEARMPPDERDLVIGQRSIHSAYFVLIGGVILAGCVMPFNSSGWAIVNAAIFMIVVAEVVRSGLVVYGYRAQS